MMKSLKKSVRKYRCFAAIAAAMAIMPASANADALNGGTGTPGDDPPIVVGADWFATTDTPPAFFWIGGDGAPNLEGPFTFNALTNVVLDVTDDFLKGDRFEVFDFGASLGLTSLVPVAEGLELGPEAAFNDPSYSSGSYLLGPGAHSITMATVVSPYDGGRGYLRVTPEPSSALLAVVGIVGLCGYALRRRRAGISSA
ncbi:MAG: PEP-CTERM sorting domain-containing protein [Pirellulales bacterium]